MGITNKTNLFVMVVKNLFWVTLSFVHLIDINVVAHVPFQFVESVCKEIKDFTKKEACAISLIKVIPFQSNCHFFFFPSGMTPEFGRLYDRQASE